MSASANDANPRLGPPQNTIEHTPSVPQREAQKLAQRPDANAEHSKLEQKLARSQEQLEAFLAIDRAIVATEDLEKVLELIAEKASQLMRAERSSIFLLDHKQGLLVSQIAQAHSRIQLELGQGIAGKVALDKQSLNIKDVYKSPFFDPSQDLQNNFKTRSCLCMPILDRQQQLLGVVEVINKVEGYFNLEDEAILSALCTQIGLLLARHLLYLETIQHNIDLRETQATLEKRNRELDILYGLERQAAKANNLIQVANIALAQCRQSFATSMAAFLLQENKQLSLYCLGPDKENNQVQNSNPPLNSTILQQILKHPQGLRLNNRDYEGLKKQSAKVFGCALEQVLSVPIFQQEQTFGYLILGRAKRSDPYFSPEESKLAHLFSAHIGLAIRSLFERQASEKQERLTTIGQMMASLLHDMKTPLAIISGYVEMMVQQELPNKRARFAENIDKQVDTLKTMSEEILLYARGESRIILSLVNCPELLEEVFALLQPEAKQRQIKLSCDPRYCGKIKCDPLKIQRALLNLAKNAIEAIGQNGQVILSSYASGAQIYLSVEDDGPGIPAELGEQIYDPFVTLGKRRGTGLGLAIVKKIVDEHGASISFHRRPNKGTIFVMAFKMAKS